MLLGTIGNTLTGRGVIRAGESRIRLGEVF